MKLSKDQSKKFNLGEYAMEWFLKLDEQSQNFLKDFIMSSGSLKKLAQDYGVSYPTIRLWVNQLMHKIEAANQENSEFEGAILKMVAQGDLSISNAQEIIKKYQQN